MKSSEDSSCQLGIGLPQEWLSYHLQDSSTQQCMVMGSQLLQKYMHSQQDTRRARDSLQDM